MKFIRRPDLTDSTRITIALEAITNMGTYGFITQLARTYNVSRTFIYSLIHSVLLTLYIEINSIPNPSGHANLNKQLVDKDILHYRLEGKSSIESISNMFQYKDIYPSSVGYISQCLAYYGKKLPNTINVNSSEKVLLIWLNDEIYAHEIPILVTIEPKSIAMLRIELAENRDSSTWSNHFNHLTEHNIHPILMSSDRGQGITKASKETFENVPFQPDTFHDMQNIGKVIISLENSAYKAIAYEYKRESVISSAVSPKVILERRFAYNEAKEQAHEAIELYDQAHYLFCEITEILEFIDKNGRFRSYEKARQDILAAIELLKSLDHLRLFEVVETFEANLDELLLYMHTAEEIYLHLSEKITNQELLQALCLAWRCDHKLYHNPTSAQRVYLKDVRDFFLQYSEILAEQNYSDLKEYVFSCLDNIIRGSSLVEAVNSLIRPYLNTCKGQITQEMLNLIMFYHNHKRFNHGKRKGKAPIEILTGQKLEKHWLDILIDTVKNS